MPASKRRELEKAAQEAEANAPVQGVLLMCKPLLNRRTLPPAALSFLPLLSL
jgi:hypothetical protein